MRACIALILVAFLSPEAVAQNWGRVSGIVIEEETGHPIVGANVVVAGTNFGTATGSDGRYLLNLPEGTYVLRITAIGYRAYQDTVRVHAGRTTTLDVSLETALFEMEGITVEEAPMSSDPGVYDLSPEDVRNIPSPFKGFQSLKVLPGVATNNELSNQYSVRGGGFNENLIFINGFEVHMPFRPKQGEQEGLGLLNPDLASRITLYTGGFPARYGGKLSSALETQYLLPHGDSMSGSASLSLLDAGVSHRGAAGSFGWNLGVRKARAQHFFNTQELKGEYRPDYTDVQGLLGYRLASGHEIEALGIWADHRFHLDPQSRKTYFGIINMSPDEPSDLRSFWVRYRGNERDGYRTRFAGVRLSNRLSSHLTIEHDLAHFSTDEEETFDISGTAVIYQVDPQDGNPETGDGHFPTGSASQEEVADNHIAVDTWTGRGRYRMTVGPHVVETGWYVRELDFSDRIREQTSISGKNTDGEFVRIVVDSLSDAAAVSTTQAGFYLQDAFDAGPLLVTGGVRSDYFDFNGEWTFSPRLSARYEAGARLVLTGSWGYYHQTPTYRELRGKPQPGETILGALNRAIRAQRSIQYVAGAEYFIPSRRLHIRGEAFYKDLDRLISYDIQNVRVLYSGENDARGSAYGLDLRVRGELVPGLQSWLNYSYLNSKEYFLAGFEDEYTEGQMPRPSDQRHTVSLFVQDYIPGDPTWKVHMRGLFGSGLPYTPPVPGPKVGIYEAQVPGPRNSGRYPEYRRVDMGITKLIDFGASVGLELTAELLNVFDMTNTVAFSWVPNDEGIWQRIPTRLTPRTFNLRARLDF